MFPNHQVMAKYSCVIFPYIHIHIEKLYLPNLTQSGLNLMKQPFAFLVFLPATRVRAMFMGIRNSAVAQMASQAHPDLEVFFDYFDDTYINGQFRIPMWNCYHRDMDSRSNNRLECKYF